MVDEKERERIRNQVKEAMDKPLRIEGFGSAGWEVCPHCGKKLPTLDDLKIPKPDSPVHVERY